VLGKSKEKYGNNQKDKRVRAKDYNILLKRDIGIFFLLARRIVHASPRIMAASETWSCFPKHAPVYLSANILKNSKE